MTHPPVLTKADFVRRYQLGEFGNRSPTWENLDAYLASGYVGGLLHLRNRIAGDRTWYDVQPDRIELVWNEALALGYKPEMLYISAMAPTEFTTFQGEVMQSPQGLSLFYSTLPKTMRASLAERASQVYGATAVALLRHYIDPVDYDWLQVLLDRYPGHVIEFSCYDRYFGTISNRRCVIWEVRAY